VDVAALHCKEITVQFDSCHCSIQKHSMAMKHQLQGGIQAEFPAAVMIGLRPATVFPRSHAADKLQFQS
jgi:hypothetical protein